jgi:hypothetical protein
MEKCSLAPLTYKQLYNFKEVCPGFLILSIDGYMYRSPPPVCQYDRGGPTPSADSEREALHASDGCLAGTDLEA